MSKQNIPDALPIQQRAATVDSFDYDKRTVTFALTSEMPVSRWYGEEILDHSESSIDTERLKRGIPLLFNHDPNQHIGRIEGYEVKDKKLYVTARFGNSPLAQQKLDDVRDGILVDASGGYIPRDYQYNEGKKGAPDTVRWTNWQPAEGSLCPVPADPSVGIGRSFELPVGTPTFPVRSLSAAPVAEVVDTGGEVKPAETERSTQSKPAEAEIQKEVVRMEALSRRPAPNALLG